MVVHGVEQEVRQVAGEHEQEDHVEVLERDVEGNEVVVVSSMAGEVQVLAKCRSGARRRNHAKITGMKM